MNKPLRSAEELADLAKQAEARLAKMEEQIQVKVHLGTCGISSGAIKILELFNKEVELRRLSNVVVSSAGCIGLCGREPVVTILFPGKEKVIYCDLEKDRVPIIVLEHLVKGKKIDEWTLDLNSPWFKLQEIRVMRNQDLDPMDIDQYIARGGYQALAKALTQMKPDEVIDEIKRAGLRGRGGAGFPTAIKWGFVRNTHSEEKYVVCNGDEGDPGAYMNRSVLEGNPHSIIEGMAIGACAIGNVCQGYAYVRSEYPLAIQTLEHAIAQAKDYGFLGKDILGTGFNFDLEIFPGAGAFVCGEETALLGSIEGKRGNPRQRPPFPANMGGGLFGKPTTINNVETWSNIPQIISRGADWFASVGTEKSKGTKTLCLVGKVENTGLVEVPLGMPLETLIFDIGGGIINGKKFRAVQLGGPSGGVIPLKHIDTPIDYEAVTALGAIMGSGGVVVMDEDDCMVDIAKFFLGFTKDESCGKCTPCRAGIPEMLQFLEKVSQGKATLEELDTLYELAEMVASASLCGLGQTSPNPVLTTLRHFREEYEAHIIDKRCLAGVCKPLLAAHALEDKCLSCLEAIAGYEEGGYEAFKTALPELVTDRLMDKLKTSGCAVDLARFSLIVPAQNNICTKCPPCRLGIVQMRNILDDIATGNGKPEMIDLLFELGDTMRVASECPVGKTAPDIVLFTLEHFRDQYEEHISGKRCPNNICGESLLYHTACPLKDKITA